MIRWWHSDYIWHDKNWLTQYQRLHQQHTKNLKLNPTHEEHNSIDYIDLTVLWKHNKFEVDIYRKPTTTDTTINFMSNHPIEQKTAAYRFHITRMQSLPLDPNKSKKYGRQYNPLQRTTTFHNTSFKNSTDRYTTELITHAIEIKTTEGPGPHSLIIVPKYGNSPTCLEIPRQE